MKKNNLILSSLFLAATLILVPSCGQSVKKAIPADREMENYIHKVLSGMSIEEKVGQMTQLTVGTILKPDGKTIDEAALDSIICKYKVGSILNVPGDVCVDVQTYKEIINKIQEISMREIGIPCLYGLDHIHGANYVDGATFFPQPVNLGASFNKDWVRIMAEVTAYETRACLVPWTFAPVMDLGRDARWSRAWESFGEDVLLNSVMAVEAVKGFQGDDPNHIDDVHVATCIKHYMGYGVPVSGKDRTPSSIGSRDLREKYFEPFRACLQAGALSLMVNSASNNGIPFHANHELLTQWVKKELNWDGMIVTDWADINNLYTREHVAADEKEAIKLAINAGIDMSMVPYSVSFATNLLELVKEGEVPLSRIDDAVLRILRLKYRLGLFENPLWDGEYEEFASEDYAKLAYEAALESEVLLKNDGVLPLKPGTKILVTGPNANSMRPLNGGWSYTWQGHRTDEFAEEFNTIYEAAAIKFGKANVTFVPGVEYYGDDWRNDREVSISAAVRAAAAADVILVCVGENSYCETPGNINSLALSQNQRNLVKALATTGKPIIMVLNEGRPRILSDIEPLASAVVHVLLPGNYGADALAELLSGDENFSARLPFTYPKYESSLATYDYKTSENVATMAGSYNYDAVMDVQWPFGTGLSYTEFTYSDFTVDKESFIFSDELTFKVNVTNTGKVAGKETVMLFSSDLVASSLPDVTRLRAFEKISLNPGETKTVELKIKAEDLAFVGNDGKWIIEDGDFRMKCGDRVLVINCSGTYVWDTPNR